MKHISLEKFILLLPVLALLLLLSSCTFPDLFREEAEPDALEPLLALQPFRRAPEPHDSAAAAFANLLPELPEEPEPVYPPLEPVNPEEPGILFQCPEAEEAELDIYSAPGPVPCWSNIPETVKMTFALANAGAFPEDMHLESCQSFVYHVNTHEMTALRGRGQDIYPASVTKLLTVLTALQFLDEDAPVTPGNEIYRVAANSSVAYLNTAYTLSVSQLVEAMMIPSGNDASYTLSVAAARAAAGDPDLSTDDCLRRMVEEMNLYAERLGMESSHFSTVDGYWGWDHVTTIEDMARLALAAYDCQAIRSCCGTAEVTETLLSGNAITWVNSNYMLDPTNPFYDERVKGMKTGSLTGHNSMVAILEEEGETYLVGVFGCAEKNGRYRDVLTILDWLFPDKSGEVTG